MVTEQEAVLMQEILSTQRFALGARDKGKAWARHSGSGRPIKTRYNPAQVIAPCYSPMQPLLG